MMNREEMRWLLFRRTAIEPVATLETLRNTIVAMNAKRFPKWRFDYGGNLVIEVQPQPGETAFKCLAVRGPHIQQVHFTSKKQRQTDGLQYMGFNVEEAANGWEVKPRSLYARAATNEDKVAFRNQVVEAFAATDTGDPVPWSNNCLICGKALTDPPSMARFIGPECFGSNPIAVPWAYTTADAAE